MEVSGHLQPLVRCINRVVDYVNRRITIQCCIPVHIQGMSCYYIMRIYSKLETGLQAFTIEDMELSLKNIVGPLRPLSPGEGAIWYC